MAEKQRDSKGHILRTGERQRKDGRYSLCIDHTGQSFHLRPVIVDTIFQPCD